MSLTLSREEGKPSLVVEVGMEPLPVLVSSSPSSLPSLSSVVTGLILPSEPAMKTGPDARVF